MTYPNDDVGVMILITIIKMIMSYNTANDSNYTDKNDNNKKKNDSSNDSGKNNNSDDNRICRRRRAAEEAADISPANNGEHF